MYEKLSYQITNTLAVNQIVFCSNCKITKLITKKLELALVETSNMEIKKMHLFEFI